MKNTDRAEKPSWMNPVYWQGVKIAQCQGCKRKDKAVTRFDLCWICDVASKNNYTPHNGFGNSTNLFD
jgi:hypothetical protein